VWAIRAVGDARFADKGGFTKMIITVLADELAQWLLEWQE
jgi:hypothetical protein